MIYLAGLGPGHPRAMTREVRQCLNEVDVIVGYRPYLERIRPVVDSGAVDLEPGDIGQELQRAHTSINHAAAGKDVALVSGGDTGIYGMAAALFEAADRAGGTVPSLRVLPGVSALNAAGARLGAPVGQDFATVSLSDHLTPWETIEDRLYHAGAADFVVVLYNPRSSQRPHLLSRALEILRQHRASGTPVGIVRNAYRDDEEVNVTTLASVPVERVDMVTTLVVGNSRTRQQDSWMYTPRGYGAGTP